jgi:hypothetical protein
VQGLRTRENAAQQLAPQIGNWHAAIAQLVSMSVKSILVCARQKKVLYRPPALLYLAVKRDELFAFGVGDGHAAVASYDARYVIGWH